MCFLVKEVEDLRMYGVIVPGSEAGDVVEVRRIVEKPREPPSRLAVMPVYMFDSIILKALKVVEPGPKGR